MRPVVCSILAILAGLLSALALARPAPAAAAAGAAAVPDSARMVALRDAAARAPVLLVRGEFGLREYHRPRVDSAGIGPRRPESRWRSRPALLATADAHPVGSTTPPMTPWSEIATLETQRPRALQGAVGGFVLGLALGATLAGLQPETESGDMTKMALVLGTPTAGLVAGAFLGSLSGTKVIYRAPTQEND